MSDVLDDATLTSRLEHLQGWAGTPEAGVSKTFRRADFNDSVAFVQRVAALADRANHHPDVTISWDRVTLTYVTHSAGGVTAADLDQAAAVDTELG